jgi:CRISPR-associated protein Cas5d
MTTTNNRITIRVWGDFACFTRPELKTERVSYPVITPSSARGILEAIFWEPQMHYLIDRIHIIKRGHWISIKRNEVNCTTNLYHPKPIQAEAHRIQRNMLALEDVEYLITAEVRLTRLAQPPRDNPAKYLNLIKNRARSGKCFHRPCLGNREFDANFVLEEDGAEAAFNRRRQELATSTPLVPIHYEPLGLMVYDVFDPGQREHGFRWLHDAAWVENFNKHRHPDDTLIVEDEVSKHKQQSKPRQSKPRKNAKTPASPPFTGLQIQPKHLLFQAEIRDSVIRCHPSETKILSQPCNE